MKNNITFEVLIKINDTAPVEETKYSRYFCNKYNKKFSQPHPVKELYTNNNLTINDILINSTKEFIFLILENEIIIPPITFKILPQILNKKKDIFGILPVFNDSKFHFQKANITYHYHNIRNFIEISELLFEQKKMETSYLNSEMEYPCILLKREFLKNFSSSSSLSSVIEFYSKQNKIIQANGLIVHRFLNYYFSPREDLINLIPKDAYYILDIGCAYGALGKTLKSYRKCHLTGVELNSHMAKIASKYYDVIINKRIEEVELKQKFDSIICGDVIEHLYNPLEVLKKLKKFLNKEGVLIGSVPNVAHWSIVLDLIKGRFEMIPVGLLCITHIRFFTEKELINLLEEAGFKIEYIKNEITPPTPEGERFINLLSSFYNDIELKSLKTHEFTFKAVHLN